MLALAHGIRWAFLLLVLWFGDLSLSRLGMRTELLEIAENLVLAWLAIRLISGLIRDPGLASAAAVVVWTLVALNVIGLLVPAVDLLDSMALRVGTFRLSLLGVIEGLLLLAGLIWVANAISRVLEQRIKTIMPMAPAMQVLVLKLVRIVLVTIAVVIALGSVGIDLTAFAVFSGAVGVGVGFGLQKVVSNLVSGMILLLDRSIKPGDVIQIEDTYGWITKLNARFVSVVTRDGKEFLIPNEDLITHRVVNWSYSNDLVRLNVTVGVSYDSDVRAAMALCVEAAHAVKRVQETPAPLCLLTGFGDSSVDLELRFWIRDPRNGTKNVRSDVLLGIWDRFHEHGIHIPFPQRDVHIRAIDTVADMIARAGCNGRSPSDG